VSMLWHQSLWIRRSLMDATIATGRGVNAHLCGVRRGQMDVAQLAGMVVESSYVTGEIMLVDGALI
jgi:hypothetical protein